MISATGVLRDEGFDLLALDNGAWTAHQQGRPFDGDAFLRALDLFGHRSRFVVVPDIVGAGLRSLDFSQVWLPRMHGVELALLAVQDGMRPQHVAGMLGPRLGVFVGGSTRWKEATMSVWGRAARAAGAYLHVGRVNSGRRIRLCAMAGADSFDGTSATRFAVTINKLDSAARQSAWRF